MNTTTCKSPLSLPPQRPWWRRCADAAGAAWRALRPSADGRPVGQPGEADLHSLSGLSAEILKDIGAPESMIDRARAPRAPQVDSFYRG